MPAATVRGAGRMEEIMDNLNLTTLQRGQTMVNDVAIDAFAAGFRGSLLTSKDMDYNEARTIWNAMIDRRPGLIARCAGAADVVRAVRFARDNNLLVSVRGGGHGIAGNAVCEGGVVIDLSAMKSVRVDPQTRRARSSRVQRLPMSTRNAGLRWRCRPASIPPPASQA